MSQQVKIKHECDRALCYYHIGWRDSNGSDLPVICVCVCVCVCVWPHC